jgi:hypothetical protein
VRIVSSFNRIRFKLNKDVKKRVNEGLQGAAYGERTTERMSIATWFVCRPVITEYAIKTAATFIFCKKVDQPQSNY